MEWLRKIRKEQRMKQEQVAVAAGLSRCSYTNIETGRRMPSVTVAKAIATVLGFEWTRFFE